MSKEQLEEDLRVFLLEHVHNFEQLEALRLLCRERAREWTLDELARELGLPEAAVSPALDHLRSKGMLAGTGGIGRYHFEPQTAELEQRVLSLMELYQQRRLLLIQVMSANAIERLRTSAIRTFAEAFRLRGRDKDG